MTAFEAFQKISNGGGDDFSKAILICEQKGDYCLVGGLAVNCYVEPVYTLDADLVVHSTQLLDIKELFKQHGFKIEEYPYSLNVQAAESDLRIQFTKDDRYQGFISRAQIKEVLGVKVKVASLDDLIQGKTWAWSDPNRRLSKRQKDQAGQKNFRKDANQICHGGDSSPSITSRSQSSECFCHSLR